MFKDKKLLVLEGGPQFKRATRDQYSNRVSAINHQSIDLLKSLNAWNFIKSNRLKPVKKMQVWGIVGEMIQFDHPGNERNVAHIIENDLILEALHDQIRHYPNINIINGTGVTQCEFLKSEGPEVNSVVTKQGENFTCDLLMGADGFNSIVRKCMNVNTIGMSYDQMGVVATLKLDAENPHHDVAFQRLIPNGPIALLPLSETESSLVWTTTKQHAKELVEMEASQFVASINEAYTAKFEVNSLIRNIFHNSPIKSFLSSSQEHLKPPIVTHVNDKSRAMFPLGFSHASSYVSSGVIIIGDAAHRIHPLAGQGVNLGFGDVVKITRNLKDALYNGCKINDMRYLLKYEKECLKSNIPIMMGVHAIQRLYSNENIPSAFLRAAGLTVANFPPLKKFFMDKAFA